MSTTNQRLQSAGSTSGLTPARRGMVAGITLLISASLIVGTGIQTVQATAPAPQPRVSSTSVTVGTFNVHKGSSTLGNSSGRLDRVASEIRRGGFDVVAIQEAATTMRGQLNARLRPTYAYSLVGNSRGINMTGGQIFYRPDVLYAGQTQGTIPLPTASGPQRFALYQDFYHRASGAHFLFVSVHLSNGDGRAASDRRAAQTREMTGRIKAINKAALPMIVGGDMNSNRGGKYVYDAPRQVLQGNGFGEVFDRAPARVNASFNTFNRLSRKPPKGGYRPDQIYVTGDIGVQYTETMVRLVVKKKRVGSKVKKVKLYRTPFASDHNPVRSVVTIPGQ